MPFAVQNSTDSFTSPLQLSESAHITRAQFELQNLEKYPTSHPLIFTVTFRSQDLKVRQGLDACYERVEHISAAICVVESPRWFTEYWNCP